MCYVYLVVYFDTSVLVWVDCQTMAKRYSRVVKIFGLPPALFKVQSKNVFMQRKATMNKVLGYLYYKIHY